MVASDVDVQLAAVAKFITSRARKEEICKYDTRSVRVLLQLHELGNRRQPIHSWIGVLHSQCSSAAGLDVLLRVADKGGIVTANISRASLSDLQTQAASVRGSRMMPSAVQEAMQRQSLLPCLRAIVSSSSGKLLLRRGEAICLAHLHEAEKHRPANGEITAKLRASNEVERSKQYEATRTQVSLFRKMLTNDIVHQKEEKQQMLEHEKQKSELLRQSDLQKKATRRFFERETEGRLRIAFDSEKEHSSFVYEHFKSKDAITKQDLHNEMMSMLLLKQMAFRDEVTQVRDRQRSEMLEKRVLERWREEACRLYLDTVAATQPQEQKMTRDMQAAIVRYTLQLEKGAKEQTRHHDIEQLRSYLESHFQSSAIQTVQQTAMARDRKLRLDRIMADIQANSF
ncbi:hypothetical protein DIPPA_62033 [Diplonema papillatum]|nr:hypothetical protein DIPPA_62033 [Diplonema papillatum]